MLKMRWMLLLVLLLPVVLAACGGGESAATEEAGVQPNTTAEVQAEATEDTAPFGESSTGRIVLTSHEVVVAQNDEAEVEAQTPTALCEAAVPVEDPDTREYASPEQVLEPGVNYQAIFCTSAGPVYIELFEDLTPVTVNNFVFLAQTGYYNNTIFHRVIEDFMAQGGDPTGTGAGGPGYQFEDEFVGFLTFDRPGWLAMANAGPGTNGSQFFITAVPTSHLDFVHTIFGTVLAGQDNVESIQIRDPQQGGEATLLDTVLIVTDPATVDSGYEVAAPASQEEVVTAFDELASVLASEGIGITVSQAPELAGNIADAAPEDVQADYARFLEDNLHDYRISSFIENEDCALDVFPFISLRYTMDVFASRADASAAIVDGFLDTLAEAEGYTLNEDGYYEQSTTGCEVEAVDGLKVVQRGRFIVTVQATVPVDPRFTVEVILDQIALLANERGLTEILRREL